MNSGELKQAIKCFRKSNQISSHFKTLELEGECLLSLGRPLWAVVPLAAAVSLNKGVRAASLLAEAFAILGEKEKGKEVAEEALRRDPHNKRAKKVLESLTTSG